MSVETAWNIWCIFAAIAWPLSWIFRAKQPALTYEEQWLVVRELTGKPVLMPDGSRQVPELVWRHQAPEAATAEAPKRLPKIVLGGREVSA